MGIDRIRLQNGAIVNPNQTSGVTMANTYEQNIAANQAQQARNQGLLQAARNKLQSFGQALNPSGNTILQRIQKMNPAGTGNIIQGIKDFGDHAIASNIMKGASANMGGTKPTIPEYALQSGADFQTKMAGLDPRISSALAKGYQYVQEGARALLDGPGGVTLEQAMETAKKQSDENIKGILAANTGTLTAEQIKNRNEYLPIDQQMADVAGASSGPTGYTNLRKFYNPFEGRSNLPTSLEEFQSRPGNFEAQIGKRAGYSPTEYYPSFYLDEYGPKTQEGYDSMLADLRNFTLDFGDNPYERDLDSSQFYQYARDDEGNPIGKFTNEEARKEYDEKKAFQQSRYNLGKSQLDNYFNNLASGGRVGFQAGSTEEMIKAQEAAASDPALDAIRQQLFGQDYVQDIGRGKGIAQYYTGFGLPQSLQFTQPVVETPVVTTPDVGSPTDGGGGGGGIIETGSGEQATITSPTTQPIDPSGMLPQISPTIQPITGGITGDSIDVGIPDNESGFVDPLGTMEGAPVVPGVDITGDPSQNLGSTNVGDQPMAAGPFDYLQPISTIANPEIFDNLVGVDDPQIGDVGFTNYTPSEQLTDSQSNIINDIFSLPEATVDTVMNAFSAIPQALTDLKNKTVNIFGQTFNVPQVLASLAIPGFGLATNVLSAIGGALPSDPRANALREFYDVDTAGTIQSGIMKGYNPVSGGFLNAITGGKFGEETNFGLQDAIQDRINTVTNTLQKNYGLTDAEIDSIKAGNITDAIKAKTISDIMSETYGKPTTTNNVQKLADLEDLLGREKDVIDAATTGAPQEDIGATDSIYSGSDTITGPNIDEEKGRPDDDVDTPSFEGFDSGGFDPAPAPAAPAPNIPDRGRGNGGGGGGSPGSEGPGGSDAMGSFKKGGIVDLL